MSPRTQPVPRRSEPKVIRETSHNERMTNDDSDDDDVPELEDQLRLSGFGWPLEYRRRRRGRDSGAT